MKKIILIIIISIFFNLNCYSSNYKARQVLSRIEQNDMYNLDDFSYNPVGFMYYNRLSILLQGNSFSFIKTFLDHLEWNSSVSYWNSNPPSNPIARIPGDAISSVQHINDKENITYYFVIHFGEGWLDKSNQNISLFKNDEYIKTFNETSFLDGQAVIYGDKIVLIYISQTEKAIKALWSDDDGASWQVDVIKDNVPVDLQFSSPKLTACTFKDKDSVDKIFIAYAPIGKLQPDAYYLHFEKDGNISVKEIKLFSNSGILPNQFIDDITSVQGSVSGSKTGNNIQIFLSYNKYLYLGGFIFRMNYSIDETVVNDYEKIGFGNKSVSATPRFALVPFTLISKYDGVNFRKNIGVCAVYTEESTDNSHPLIFYNLFTWDSDVIELDNIDIKSEVIEDSSMWTVVGVIEGPPPFILNGWELDYSSNNPNKLPNTFIPISNMSYGIEKTNSSSRSHTIGVSIESKNNFKGFLFGAEFSVNNEMKETIEKKIVVDFDIEPSVGENLGYYLVLKPDITRRKYNVKDHEGNIIYSFYKFIVSDVHYAMMPFDMNDDIHKLSPYNISSYMDRDYNLDAYNQIYKGGWQAANGSSNKIIYEISDTKETETEYEFNIYYGIEEKLGGTIFEPVFQTEDKVTFNFSWKTTTESTAGQNLEINVKVPDPNPNTTVLKDTNEYSGTFYWIKEKKGLNNWWIPKEGPFKGQKPWCMTWKVSEILDRDIEGMVLSINDTKNNIKIYPNPAVNNISISLEINNNSPLTISLYNELGIKVKDFSFSNLAIGKNNLKIPVNDLQSGSYHINLLGQDININDKIIIYR